MNLHDLLTTWLIETVAALVLFIICLALTVNRTKMADVSRAGLMVGLAVLWAVNIAWFAFRFPSPPLAGAQLLLFLCAQGAGAFVGQMYAATISTFLVKLVRPAAPGRLAFGTAAYLGVVGVIIGGLI